jgi:hypothetical protein
MESCLLLSAQHKESKDWNLRCINNWRYTFSHVSLLLFYPRSPHSLSLDWKVVRNHIVFFYLDGPECFYRFLHGIFLHDLLIFIKSTSCASTTRPEPQGNKQHKRRVQVYQKSKTGNKHNMTVSQKSRPWQTKAQLIRKGNVAPMSDLRPSPLLRLNGACEVHLALMVADGWTRDEQGWWLCSG